MGKSVFEFDPDTWRDEVHRCLDAILDSKQTDDITVDIEPIHGYLSGEWGAREFGALGDLPSDALPAHRVRFTLTSGWILDEEK